MEHNVLRMRQNVCVLAERIFITIIDIVFEFVWIAWFGLLFKGVCVFVNEQMSWISVESCTNASKIFDCLVMLCVHFAFTLIDSLPARKWVAWRLREWWWTWIERYVDLKRSVDDHETELENAERHDSKSYYASTLSPCPSLDIKD